MGDPGNPQTPGSEPGSEPDPHQPGWAAPDPPPFPPPAPAPAGPEPAIPPAPPGPQPQPQWGTPAPAWGAPPGGAVPPAPGAGWPQPVGPPARKRRLTWLWILIPVLVILVASTVVVGVYAIRLAVEPIDETNEFLADISAGRYDEATDDLCAAARLGVENPLVRQQQLDGERGRITSWNITGFEFPNDDVSDVIDAITTGTVVRGGVEYDVRVGLSREDDEWKVCTAVER